MANIVFTNGSVTTDGTEQTLFDITADKYFATSISCHNMQSGDVIQVRLYRKDSVGGSNMRKDIDEPVSYVTTLNNGLVQYVYLHLLPAREYKVTIQRTNGSDRTYTWERAEI